ncbi:hypothetical protein [Methanosphaera sp. BMS]|uniref:hypothetical protein n=1 Tax=Methanosphaera sp. BMS TaxID=1789762 RepID=UPI0013A6CF21|nr:hypothetical protein [Methanosphaera sp. BMS]
MDDKERMLIKTLNKLGVDTRYVSLYEEEIYVNNLKFSRFSRKKEDEFHQSYPDIQVIRSKLFQKICVKVSRTVKNQIMPRDILYIEDDGSVESVLLKVVLEPYKRKYGIRLTDNIDEANKLVSTLCINDFVSDYISLMITGNKITNSLENDVVYPLMHIDKSWINDWICSTALDYSFCDESENKTEDEIIEFLDTKIPNVCESIIQSVDYLDAVDRKI